MEPNREVKTSPEEMNRSLNEQRQLEAPPIPSAMAAPVSGLLYPHQEQQQHNINQKDFEIHEHLRRVQQQVQQQQQMHGHPTSQGYGQPQLAGVTPSGIQLIQTPQMFYDLNQLQYAINSGGSHGRGLYGGRPGPYFGGGAESFSLAGTTGSSAHSAMLQQAQSGNLYATTTTHQQPNLQSLLFQPGNMGLHLQQQSIWTQQPRGVHLNNQGSNLNLSLPSTGTANTFVPLVSRGGHYLENHSESDEDKLLERNDVAKKAQKRPGRKPTVQAKPSVKPRKRGRKPTNRIISIRLKLDGEWLRQPSMLTENISESSDSDELLDTDTEEKRAERIRNFVGHKTPRIQGESSTENKRPYCEPLSALIKPQKKVSAGGGKEMNSPKNRLPSVNRVSLAKLTEEERANKCLQALIQYVEACGGGPDLVKNWKATVEIRKEGSTAGSFDVYYYDPTGRRFRSRTEVARFLRLDIPTQPSVSEQNAIAIASKKKPKTANLGFGRTKKARKRANHAQRFANLTAHMRLSLADLFEQTEKRDRAKYDARFHRQFLDEAINAASRTSSPDPLRAMNNVLSHIGIYFGGDDEDRSSRSRGPDDSANISRLERLRNKLRKVRSKRDTAQARLEAANHFANQATAAADLADAQVDLLEDEDNDQKQDMIIDEKDDKDDDQAIKKMKLTHEDNDFSAQDSKITSQQQQQQSNDDDDATNSEMNDDRGQYKHRSTDDALPSQKQQMAYIARQRRLEEERCLKEVDKERKNVKKVKKQLARLEELVAEAEDAATKRNAAETERRRKKAAKEAEILVKRAEREANLEERREQKERDAANRKRERNDELEQRRIEKDAEAAAMAASKAMTELERMKKHRYPMEDMDLVHEPIIELAYPPLPKDPCDIFIGLSRDLIGHILHAHALLRGAYGTLGEYHAPNLETFVAAMVLPLSAMGHGPMSAIQEMHSALLRVLLDDSSAEAWWPQDGTNDELKPMSTEAEHEAIISRRKKKRTDTPRPRPEHPWIRTARRYQQLTLEAVSRYQERKADDDETDSETEEHPPIQQDSATLDGISNELKRGIEHDVRTRRWVSILEEASASNTNLNNIQDALLSCAKITVAPAAKVWFKARASRSPTAEMRATIAELVRRARIIRASAWQSDEATQEEKQQQLSFNAAQFWRTKPNVWRGYDAYDNQQEGPQILEIKNEIPMEIESKNASIGKNNTTDDGWWTTGSEYIGRKVRRSVYDEMGEIVSYSDGIVTGWLPADFSDYLDLNNEPAALYHIRLDSGELAGDCEDLELAEILASLITLESTSKKKHEPIKVRIKLPPELRRGTTSKNSETTGGTSSKNKGGRKRKSLPTPELSPPLENINENEELQFPRDKLAEALRVESVARRTLLSCTRSANCSDKPEAWVVYMMPRPPSDAVGSETWMLLVISVIARLLEFERDVSENATINRNFKLAQAIEWLGDGLPYGALTPSERIGLIVALCDAFSTTNIVAQNVEAAQEQRRLDENDWEKEDKELRKKATQEERRIGNEIKHRLATEIHERRLRRLRSNSEGDDDDLENREKKIERPVIKKPRRATTAAPISTALDQLLDIRAPVLVLNRNPKQKGSKAYNLYENYKKATTIDEIIQLGGRRGDIFNDLNRGYCKLLKSEHEDIYMQAKATQPPRGPGKPPSSQQKPRTKPAARKPAARKPAAAPAATPPTIPIPPTISASGDEDSPKPDDNKPILSLPQLPRHRLNAEKAHVRAIDACGGGNVEFIDTLEELESHESPQESNALRPKRERGLRALTLATEARDIFALGIAIEYAKRPDVMLEICIEIEQNMNDELKTNNSKNIDEKEENDILSDTKINQASTKISSNKKLVIRQLVNANVALRENQIKANNHDRRCRRAAKRRHTIFPRIDPLGTDRHFHSYWLFPTDLDTERRIDTTNLIVWRRLRSESEEIAPDTRLGPHNSIEQISPESNPSAWSAYVGVENIRQLAQSLDDRGVRERELKNALYDILPLKTAFVDLSFLEDED